ncbi:MAG TPA: hypothetical protein VD906_15450, partial [Caulobacteraceae bacterium]|nr:hypothetical protein [Caulobacteraceae bacterium]
MWDVLIERWGAFARALLDRLAYLVESLGVALLVIAFVALAALRFDLSGAAYVWGFFWMRVAETDDAVRLPVLGLLTVVVVAATGFVGWVRWTRASR